MMLAAILLLTAFGQAETAPADGPLVIALPAVDSGQVEIATPLSLPWQAEPGPARVRLYPVGAPAPVDAITGQWERAAPGRAVLRWPLTPGAAGARVYAVENAPPPSEPRMRAAYDAEAGVVRITDGGLPVLTYHHAAKPAPEGVDPVFERGGYVSALYGPSGELLTEDYPADHVHHRPVAWAWATITWNGETRDMFGIRTPYQGEYVGVAKTRPVRMARVESGPYFAVLEAESRWMWDDATPIAEENAVIRAYALTRQMRVIDFEITVEAVVDGLRIGGRVGGGYSGFTLRMAPAEDPRFEPHLDAEGAPLRRAWADYAADFEGAAGRSGVALLQHRTNPDYPSGWRIYPQLHFFQPLFPGDRLIPLPKGKPLALEYRLIVHKGEFETDTLAALWEGYNLPPRPVAAPGR
jgi:hypothetical protein